MAGVFGVSKDEFVTSLAALVLYDGEAEITADNIRTVLSASNNSVAPYWPALFGNFLKNGNAERLVFSVGGAAAAAPAPVAAAAPAAGGAAGKLMIENTLFMVIN